MPISIEVPLPDSDTTVLAVTTDDEYPCWPAYHDGEKWLSADSTPLRGEVRCWLHLDAAADAISGEATVIVHGLGNQALRQTYKGQTR